MRKLWDLIKIWLPKPEVWETVQTIEVDAFLIMEFHLHYKDKTPDGHRWILVQDKSKPSGCGWRNGIQVWALQKLKQ